MANRAYTDELLAGTSRRGYRYRPACGLTMDDTPTIDGRHADCRWPANDV